MSERSIEICVLNPYQDTGQGVSLADAVSSADPLALPVVLGVDLLYPIALGESLERKSQQGELFPVGQANEREVDAAVARLLAFRPDPEEPNDEDLHRGPQYRFP